MRYIRLTFTLIFGCIISQANANEVNICVGEDIILEATDYQEGDLQWQRSVDGQSTWTNIEGATSTTYIASPEVFTHYRLQITDPNCDPSVYYTDTWFVRVLNIRPNPPTEGVHSSSDDHIEWNWEPSTSAGAVYYYNIENDFETATNNGSATTLIQTGLDCFTDYTLYVWVETACGNSDEAEFTYKTQAGVFNACGDCVPVEHAEADSISPVEQFAAYSTTSIGTQCWTTRNLGATEIAAHDRDATIEAAGWYWQFDRKQAYKHDYESLTPEWNTDLYTGHGSNWTQDNDPCRILLGSNWRIPTRSEWENSTNWSGTSNELDSLTRQQAFESPLVLHPAGRLKWEDGSLEERGSFGYYWSSTHKSEKTAWRLTMLSLSGSISNKEKRFGYSIRCIMN
jgi:uncharacterized protein (TIGR02145 family)